MATRTADVEPEIEGLFRLPLGEFTAARNALASRLRKEGATEEAERVKGLAKPPISAWAVNQLYWRDRKRIEALLEIGERFRKAQAAQLAGRASDLRELLNERRNALSALMKEAGRMLEEANHAASPDVTRRIMTTLDALATYGRVAGAPRAGRLTDDLDPPGFEALAALVPRGRGAGVGAPSRILRFQQQHPPRGKRTKTAEDQAALRARARAAVHEAEKALREAQRDAARAEAALKKAAGRARTVQNEFREVEAQYERLQADLREANKEAHRVAEEAENAAQRVADAERELERARTALEASERTD